MMQRLWSSRMTAFELMRQEVLQLTVDAANGVLSPFRATHPSSLLIEAAGQDMPGALRPVVVKLLEYGFRNDLVQDGVIAASGAERDRCWELGGWKMEAQKPGGSTIKRDISVPVSVIPLFIEESDKALEAAIPGVRYFSFGRWRWQYSLQSDGPLGRSAKSYASSKPCVSRIVHDVVAEFCGSASGEHGVGQPRVKEILRYKSDLKMEMMRIMKKGRDPHGLMNSDRIFSPWMIPISIWLARQGGQV